MKKLILMTLTLVALCSTSAFAIWWTDNAGNIIPAYWPNGNPQQYNGTTFGPDTPQASLIASGLVLQGYSAPVVVTPTLPPVTYPTQAQVQQRLANAYNTYLQNRFNSIGVALVLAGVMNSKPDSLAVKVWMNQLSADFRTRSAAVPAVPDATYTPNYDYSNNGEPPFTVWQIEAEVGL